MGPDANGSSQNFKRQKREAIGIHTFAKYDVTVPVLVTVSIFTVYDHADCPCLRTDFAVSASGSTARRGISIFSEGWKLEEPHRVECYYPMAIARLTMDSTVSGVLEYIGYNRVRMGRGLPCG